MNSKDLELITRKAVDLAFVSSVSDTIIGQIAAALITQALTQGEIKDALLAWNAPKKAK